MAEMNDVNGPHTFKNTEGIISANHDNDEMHRTLLGDKHNMAFINNYEQKECKSNAVIPNCRAPSTSTNYFVSSSYKNGNFVPYSNSYTPQDSCYNRPCTAVYPKPAFNNAIYNTMSGYAPNISVPTFTVTQLPIRVIGDVSLIAVKKIPGFLGEVGPIIMFLRGNQIRHTLQWVSMGEFQTFKREFEDNFVMPCRSEDQNHFFLKHDSKIFTESISLLRYLSKKLGLYGINAVNDYRVDTLADQLHVWSRDQCKAAKSAWMEKERSKRLDENPTLRYAEICAKSYEAIETLLDATQPAVPTNNHSGSIETEYFGVLGPDLSYADFYLLSIINDDEVLHNAAALPHIDISNFPRIARIKKQFNEHAYIKSFYSGYNDNQLRQDLAMEVPTCFPNKEKAMMPNRYLHPQKVIQDGVNYSQNPNAYQTSEQDSLANTVGTTISGRPSYNYAPVIPAMHINPKNYRYAIPPCYQPAQNLLPQYYYHDPNKFHALECNKPYPHNDNIYGPTYSQ